MVDGKAQILLDLIQGHSPSLYLHGLRVAYMAQTVAPFFGLDGKEAFWAGLFHDAGKLCLPQEVLRAPRPLTEEEKREMRRHAEYGARLVREAGMSFLEPSVLFHHERWDGRGYPHGLRGPDIPPLARLLALADAYDAMTASRPYRKALSPKGALQEILSHAGSQFDPGMAEAFVRLLFLNPPPFKVLTNGRIRTLQVSRIPYCVYDTFRPSKAGQGSMG